MVFFTRNLVILYLKLFFYFFYFLFFFTIHFLEMEISNLCFEGWFSCSSIWLDVAFWGTQTCFFCLPCCIYGSLMISIRQWDAIIWGNQCSISCSAVLSPMEWFCWFPFVLLLYGFLVKSSSFAVEEYLQLIFECIKYEWHSFQCVQML